MTSQVPSNETPDTRLRFRPDQRLRSGRDFGLVYSEGNRARAALLIVVVRRNTTGRTRLGLSIGRRIWRSAVKRNVVRRIFREAFRLEQHALPQGIDIVLIAAEPRLRPTLAATRKELVYLAHKALRRYDDKVEAANNEATPE